jgi:hypothetical protein
MHIATKNVSMDVSTKQIKHEYILSTKNVNVDISTKT